MKSGEQFWYEVSQILLCEVGQYCQAIIVVPHGLIEKITVVVTAVIIWLVRLEVFIHSLNSLLHDRKSLALYCEIRQTIKDEIQEILLFLIVTRYA